MIATTILMFPLQVLFVGILMTRLAQLGLSAAARRCGSIPRIESRQAA
jgi:hypothetical protein